MFEDIFEKAAESICKIQKKDGSWELEAVRHEQPRDYLKQLVLTSQATQTLILTGSKKAIPSINKGFFYCLDYELEPNDPLVFWIWKLRILKYFKDIEKVKKETTEMTKHIVSKQKSGYWPAFPTTFNLTNFNALIAIHDMCEPSILEKSRKWFLKNKAKDKIGWGKDEEEKDSWTTFTSNVATALILSGEDPLSKDLTKVCTYLEKKMLKNGSWASTKYTTKEPTIYATSVATVALMLLSENPFNEKVEKGVEFLKKTQLKNGGWPLVKGGKMEIYTTFYAVYTLAFYRHLKNEMSTNSVKMFSKKLKTQRVVAFLFKRFEKRMKEELNKNYLGALFSSKMLGSTLNAVSRRKDILNVLNTKGPKDVAAVIDELKKQDKYSDMNKRHHITQVKSDLEYLRSIKVVDKIHDLYYIVFNAEA